LVLYKGALEDPSLQRAQSETGFTWQEEITAFNADMVGNLTNLFIRANFEEPSGGWPEPIHVVRPKQPVKRKREKQKDDTPDWRKLVDFTNSIHAEAMEGN